MRDAVVVCVVLGLFMPVAGCSSSDSKDGGPPGGALCAWLAGDNCWKTATNAAAACLPPSAESGVLNATDTACTYASGATVAFNTPLMTTSLNPTFDFAVADANGQTCMTFKSLSNAGFALEVAGQAVTLTYAQGGLTLTCPDGSQHAGNTSDLFSCTDAALSSILPSYGFKSAGTYDFSLEGTAGPTTSLQVFSCSGG